MSLRQQRDERCGAEAPITGTIPAIATLVQHRNRWRR